MNALWPIRAQPLVRRPPSRLAAQDRHGTAPGHGRGKS
jgi:hypothetical protein